MPTPLTGQLSVTGTAAQITTPVATAAFTIKAPLTNAQAVFIGPSTVTSGNGYQLDPGDTFDYERLSQSGAPIYQLNVSDFWAVGTSGDKVAWLASPA